MTIRSLLFDGKHEERPVELDAGVIRSLGRDRLLWVDLADPDDDELRDVAAILAIPAQLRPRPGQATRPVLQRHQRWIRLAIVAAQPPGDGGPGQVPLTTVPLEVLAGENVVVTVHEGPVAAVDALTGQLRDEPGVGALTAAALVAALIDEVLTIYLRHAEAIERRIDVLDELAIRGSTVREYLAEVVALRRRVATLRRALAPHREVFGPLARPDFEIAALGKPWPGLVDRLEATIYAIETVRELLIGSIELQQSSTAQHVNDVVVRLTVLNAVLLPAVVLAGIMGMNFQLEFFKDPEHFWIVIGAMVLFAATTLIVARLRRWV